MISKEIAELVNSDDYRGTLKLPQEVAEDYELLAQGEYNVNYLFTHPVTGRKLVLRINMGSQMHLERQIEYEAHALGLLAGSGRTPKVYFIDNSKEYIENGVLVMDFLPGRYPVYESAEDMNGIMRCMADIHSATINEDAEVIYGEPFGENSVPSDTVKLIAPGSSAGSIVDECESMLSVYMDSPLGDDKTKKRLRRLLDRAGEIAKGSIGGDPPLRCCVNTELNSTNFLVDDCDNGFVRLVDWEKPLYADPAQDLGHLLAPTTTFWKTDCILSSEETDRLIDEYIKAVDGRFDTEGIKERTKDLINVTCLRGLTWCAMAWVEYKDPSRPLLNESTRIKLDQYLSDSFLKEIESRLLLVW